MKKDVYEIRVDGANENIYLGCEEFLTDEQAIKFAYNKARNWRESLTVEVRKLVAPRKWKHIL